MLPIRHPLKCLLLALGLLALQAHADDAIDVGNAVPDAKAVDEGLFPEVACEELKAAGFKCMGFKPAVRYSLPASSFALGSAELPETLKKQLDVFAEVLKTKRGSNKTVRIEGHADASGASSRPRALVPGRCQPFPAWVPLQREVSLGWHKPEASARMF